MFNGTFYPTPPELIAQMLEPLGDLQNKAVLEPSAGSGRIVEALIQAGANVIACELEDDLRKIVTQKCTVIAADFLKVESHQVSHLSAIVMNPPFNNAGRHIAHAWEIAPAGCKIVALCNLETLTGRYSYGNLRDLSKTYGYWVDLGTPFASADRATDVKVAMLHLEKPGASYEQEFEGFYMFDEEEKNTGSGLMKFNEIRELVNRYVTAVKLFDKQLDLAIQMNELTSSFFSSSIGFVCMEKDKVKTRGEYKKDLQKQGWAYIFKKLNLAKVATKGLREDINKFVETQTHIPFTMRNIYRMLEIVIGTTGSRMDKALLEVFEKLTEKYAWDRESDVNRYYHSEQWKSNSHYLLGKKFIMPNMVSSAGSISYHGNGEIIEDLLKALCFITGDDYNEFIELRDLLGYDYKLVNTETGEYVRGEYGRIQTAHEYQTKAPYYTEKPGVRWEKQAAEPGKWFDWAYFRIKYFKKGTMHFEFLSDDLWAQFNGRIGKIKGYPLFEARKQTNYQERNTGRAKSTEWMKEGSLF